MELAGYLLSAVTSSAIVAAAIHIVLKHRFDRQLEQYKAALKTVADREVEALKQNLLLEADRYRKRHDAYARLSELIERSAVAIEELRNCSYIEFDDARNPLIPEQCKHLSAIRSDLVEWQIISRLYVHQASILSAVDKYQNWLRVFAHYIELHVQARQDDDEDLYIRHFNYLEGQGYTKLCDQLLKLRELLQRGILTLE